MTVDFGAITFEKSGTYEYKIKETAGEDSHWAYDSHEYTVTITVTNEDGVLKAAVSSDAAFENPYTADPVTVDDADASGNVIATKVATGDIPNSTTFNFTIEAQGDAPKADPATGSVTITEDRKSVV